MEKIMKHAFTIREMTIEDLREATEMRMQSWKDAYTNESLGVTAEFMDTMVAEELAEQKYEERVDRFHKSDFKGWVACDKTGKIIGVSQPFTMEDGTQNLGGMYVGKLWVGRGVGAALMQKVLAFHDLSKPIVLSVATYNERAKAFYRKHGFEEITDSLEFFKEKIPTVRMIRKGAVHA